MRRGLCSAPAMTYRAEIDRYWVEQYLVARETYDPDTVEARGRLVAALSAPGLEIERDACDPGVRPCERVRTNAPRVDMVVDSVAVTGFEAVVWFAKRREGKPVQYWIATIGFAYVVPPLDGEERSLNPWGFQVRRYRAGPALAASSERLEESFAAGDSRP